jgi:hypothetical protein
MAAFAAWAVHYARRPYTAAMHLTLAACLLDFISANAEENPGSCICVVCFLALCNIYEEQRIGWKPFLASCAFAVGLWLRCRGRSSLHP